MKLGIVGCALGMHRVDHAKVRKVYGRETSHCSRCRQVLEQQPEGRWIVPPMHDAGLGHRSR